jgi:tetratricopeptide (TPR) repeat protein
MEEYLPPHLELDIDLNGQGFGSFLVCVREMSELPPALEQEIERLFRVGSDFMDTQQYVEAARAYRACLELLPQPRASWVASVRFLCGIGDALWFLRKHAAGLPFWNAALMGGSLGNEFAHLRRGQTLYELGRRSEAANELLRALLLGGCAIFADEPPQYYEFITSYVKAPAGRTSWDGWPGLEEGSPYHERLLDYMFYELRWAPQD